MAGPRMADPSRQDRHALHPRRGRHQDARSETRRLVATLRRLEIGSWALGIGLWSRGGLKPFAFAVCELAAASTWSGHDARHNVGSQDGAAGAPCGRLEE